MNEQEHNNVIDLDELLHLQPEPTVSDNALHEAEPALESAPPVPQRHGAGSLIAGIIAGALVLGLVLTMVFSWNWIQGSFIHSFGTPQEYLIYVEEQMFDSGIDALVQAYGQVQNAPTSQSSHVRMEMVLGDAVLQELQNSLTDSGISADLDWLKRIFLEADFTMQENLSQYDLWIGLQEQQILSAQVLLDLPAETVWVQLPELSDEAIYIASDLEQQQVQQQALKKLMEKLPEQEVMEQILYAYAQRILSHIQDVEEKTEQVQIGDLSQEMTVLSTSFTEADLCNVMIDLLETAKSDDQLRPILVAAVEYYYETTPVDSQYIWDELNGTYSIIYMYEEVDAEAKLDEGIDNALEELRERRENSDPNDYVTLQVYVNGSHKICGQTMIDSEGTQLCSYLVVTKGEHFALRVEAEDLRMEGSGTIQKQMLVGQVEMIVDNESLLTVRFSDWDLKKLDKQEWSGTLWIYPSEESIAEADTDLAMTVLEIGISGNTEGCAMNIRMMNEDEVLLQWIVQSEQREPTAIILPESGVNSNDTLALQDWVLSMDFTSLLQNLRDAGLPEEYVQYVEAYVNMIHSQVQYDEYFT